jgi:hypothetical protein
MLANAHVGEEQIPRVIVPAQHLLIGEQVVDAAVAFLAGPDTPIAHLQTGELATKPFIAVAAPRNEVVERQESTQSFA